MYAMYAAKAGVFLLCFDPTLGELQLFHSPSVIGGGIVNPMTFLVALSGIGFEASLIAFNEASIINIDVKTPIWKDFKDTGNDAMKFQALKSERTAYKLKNLLRIPHALAVAFINLPEKDPSSIAAAFMNTFNDHDQKVDEAAVTDPTAEQSEKLSDEFICAIQFCWLAL